jgi:hypothetical protein
MKKQYFKSRPLTSKGHLPQFSGHFSDADFQSTPFLFRFSLSEAINNFLAAYLTKISNSKLSTRKNSEIEIT